MTPEQRLAGVASLALLVTMFFPWYGLQSLNRRTEAISSHNISAFGDVSFVEAAVFLVAVAVVVIVLARAEDREFQLPGGDGTIVMIAGGWAGLLIFYRVFDRPAGHGYPVGIEWGFFLAFVAAGAVAFAGWRMRASERPEPRAARHRRTHLGSPPDRGRPPDRGSRPQTRSAPERGPGPGRGSGPGSGSGSGSGEEVTAIVPKPRRPAPSGATPARGRAGRPPYPPAPPEQLSFEDPQPGSD
jgi:type IV secretory pathway TrbD component